MSNDKNARDPKVSSDDLTKQILGSIATPYTGEQTSKWIAKLDDVALMSEVGKTDSESALANVSAVRLCDLIFDDFQRYNFEFSKSSGGALLNCGRPMPVSAASTPRGKPQVLCQGYLSTSNWGIVFQGFPDQVSAYIIPIDFIIGFKSGQDQFLPFVTLTAVKEGDRTGWTVENYPISRGMLTVLTKRFFGALIKVDRGEAEHSEPFLFDPTIKQEEQMPLPPHVDEGPPQLLSEAQMWAERQAQAQQMQERRSQSGQIAQPTALSDSDNLDLSLSRAFDRNKLVVVAAFDEFVAKLDHELDTLTKIGMKTLQVQDAAGAQKTIYRSAKLKEMRQRVNELSNEWKAIATNS